MTSEDVQFSLNQLLKRPVAFFPAFAKISGSVNAGVMLSQLWYWSDGRAWNKEGWIWKTALEWSEEASLTESEVEGARKKLVERGLVQYKRAGLPAKPHYLLNKQAILDAVISLQTCAASSPKNGKQGDPDSTNKTSETFDSGLPKCAEQNTEISPESSSKITSTPPEPVGGGGDGVNFRTLIWQEGELASGIEEFIASAVWMQQKCGGVRNLVGFRSKIRKRVMEEDPNQEDWETLRAYRASQTKPTSSENPESDKQTMEKKRQLADAKRRYAAMEEAQQKKIESQFAAHLQASNTFAYKIYLKSGLKSGAVTGAFNEWLVGELE